MGQNCATTGRCVAAQVSCAAQKSSYPASTDGVYWISPAGVAHRAYCDMAISAELCTEIEGEHRGRTRDKAALSYVMKSILLSPKPTMWATSPRVRPDTSTPFTSPEVEW